MPKDIRHRLERARQTVASWLLPSDDSSHGRHGKRISTPQLVKRNLHVSYDSLSGTYQGVPDKWLSEFERRLAPSNKQQLLTVPAASAMSFASLPANSTRSSIDEDIRRSIVKQKGVSESDSPPPSPPPRLAERMMGRSCGAWQPSATQRSSRHQEQHQQQQQLQEQTQQQKHRKQPVVWFDQNTRRFVNLPRHWRERLQRNNLADLAEFQRNPTFLATVFSMMDDELRQMDLGELGLDSSVHSSEPDCPEEKEEEDKTAKTDTKPASTASAGVARCGVVWRQQRSFVKDDDSDSEEFTEM